MDWLICQATRKSGPELMRGVCILETFAQGLFERLPEVAGAAAVKHGAVAGGGAAAITDGPECVPDVGEKIMGRKGALPVHGDPLPEREIKDGSWVEYLADGGIHPVLTKRKSLPNRGG